VRSWLALLRYDLQKTLPNLLKAALWLPGHNVSSGELEIEHGVFGAARCRPSNCELHGDTPLNGLGWFKKEGRTKRPNRILFCLYHLKIHSVGA
jgi:hypothetical protein